MGGLVVYRFLIGVRLFLFCTADFSEIEGAERSESGKNRQKCNSAETSITPSITHQNYT
jgi:hypothetical protein